MSFDLSYLFNGSPPAAVTTPAASTSTLPDWYQQYIQNIAAKGTQVAGAQAGNYPQFSVAGFAPDTTSSFGQVRNIDGSFQPALNNAQGVASTIPGIGSAAATNANSDVAGATNSFTGNNVSQYMSPYTSQVVNALNNSAMQTWKNQIMPGVNESAIGTGGFGSTRNADLLGQAGNTFMQNLEGQDAQALQSGFQQGSSNFQADQARAQAQEQLQANTALQGGQLSANSAQTGAQTQGTLAQLSQNLGLQGATALNAVGQQEQAQNQNVLNTTTQNNLNSMNQDWTNLNNLSGLIRGNTLPTSSLMTTQGPAANYSASPLAQLAQVYGLNNASSANSQTGTSSDRRLKRNIKRIGTHALGIPVYIYDYVWGEKNRIGVMADEVEKVVPMAVTIDNNGFKRVNYAMIG